jgi:hypothetical protein
MSKTDTHEKETATVSQNYGITEKGKQWIKEHGYDGHSIYRSDAIPFADLGLSDKESKKLIRKYESDTSDYKSTIFKDGKIVPELEGVYLLSLWYAIAGHLGVADAGLMFQGRGSQARALCDSILSQIE